jgi:hypothetical protein
MKNIVVSDSTWQRLKDKKRKSIDLAIREMLDKEMVQ